MTTRKTPEQRVAERVEKLREGDARRKRETERLAIDIGGQRASDIRKLRAAANVLDALDDRAQWKNDPPDHEGALVRVEAVINALVADQLRSKGLEP